MRTSKPSKSRSAYTPNQRAMHTTPAPPTQAKPTLHGLRPLWPAAIDGVVSAVEKPAAGQIVVHVTQTAAQAAGMGSGSCGGRGGGAGRGRGRGGRGGRGRGAASGEVAAAGGDEASAVDREPFAAAPARGRGMKRGGVAGGSAGREPKRRAVAGPPADAAAAWPAAAAAAAAPVAVALPAAAAPRALPVPVPVQAAPVPQLPNTTDLAEAFDPLLKLARALQVGWWRLGAQWLGVQWLGARRLGGRCLCARWGMQLPACLPTCLLWQSAGHLREGGAHSSSPPHHTPKLRPL